MKIPIVASIIALIMGLSVVKAGFTGYGFANANFQPGGGISRGGLGHGYGTSYNTYGTNVYYGGGVGGGYGYHG